MLPAHLCGLVSVAGGGLSLGTDDHLAVLSLHGEFLRLVVVNGHGELELAVLGGDQWRAQLALAGDRSAGEARTQTAERRGPVQSGATS